MSDTRSRILVIDDTPKNLDVLSDLLGQHDFEVLFALDGGTGIQCAESGQPDLILLDIMMPGMNGFETCRQLKANDNTQDIPVIFMTALSDIDNKVTGFEIGAVDYITKPIQAEEVLARVNTHLEIQRIQRALKKALEREKELNKLKSRFLSIASHEFRSPLMAIQITTNTLKRHAERMTPEKKDAALERIETAVKQMSGMLDDVLLLSKAEADIHEFTPKPTDVGNICRQVVEEFNVMSEESHIIEFSGPGERIQLAVDQKLLRHIFSNLLSNAIKYSSAGSFINVELIREREHVIFRVTDHGIGISEEDRQHLFDAFHRGTNVGDIQGTGLGLSIVKQFVELHNGTIRVESEVNKGTTFTVVIPIS